MKIVIEFDDDDIGEFIEEFGDDIKESIKNRLKSALNNESITKRYHSWSSPTSPAPYVSIKIFESETEAENVLMEMLDILSIYGHVTISYYYDLVGLKTSYNKRNNEYGWTDLKNAHVKSIKEAQTWVIDLPKPVYLK